MHSPPLPFCPRPRPGTEGGSASLEQQAMGEWERRDGYLNPSGPVGKGEWGNG